MKIFDDVSMQQQLINELRWNPEIGSTDIAVAVHDGIATLTGHVSSHARRVAAERAALRIPGISGVADEIEVDLPGDYRRSDADIAAAVRLALDWDTLVPSENVWCSVTDGRVTLGGEVRTLRERELAAHAVERLMGITGITNDIVIAPPNMDSTTLGKTIEEVLARRSEREADKINVAVRGGTVQLTGSVRSWGDKLAIVGALGHMRGIQAVEDTLYVDPLT